MAEALVIAVLGAESTGKTTLAAALAARLADETGLRCTWVDEWLRRWCDSAGRTPHPHEQRDIARAQHARIAEARAGHDLVVCDTTALMTAVYSRIVFGDTSLDATAADWHKADISLSLLTALDLPWVSDGLQRDGAHVREPVDTRLRTLMHRHDIDFSLVCGPGPQRLASALAALAPWLGDRYAFTTTPSCPAASDASSTA